MVHRPDCRDQPRRAAVIVGLILAGGASSRMGGGHKALMDLGGARLIDRVAAQLRPQVDRIAVSGTDPDLALPDAALLPDIRGRGPLSGLHAGLRWARDGGADGLLSSTCDTPFIPADLADRLAGEEPAIAASQGRVHFLCGFWPVRLFDALDDLLQRDPAPSARSWAALCGARTVEWTNPDDPFVNLNTPADLAAARLALDRGA